tara:strand:+ start:27 stop:539 length:513 start_codon:yes stop_codon:yes gene_type:complete
MEEVMKDFLNKYAHIVNTVVAILMVGCLFYLGSTMNPEEEFEAHELIFETEPQPIGQWPEPIPEPIVEPDARVEEVVKEVVEVEIDTVVTDTVEEVVEVPVEVKVDSTDKADSTYTREFTQPFDVTVSEDGYLMVPDSIDSIVDARAYVYERIGSDVTFVWKDSTYEGGK